MKLKPTAVPVLLVAVLVASACGGGSDAGVEIDRAWARTSPAMATAGAAYMQITASTDDELVAAAVDDTIAGRTEIHETVMVDGVAMGDGEEAQDESMTDDGKAMDGMGEMKMQEVGRISLPGGAAVSLEPGGYHLMMLDLVEPLETGDVIEITLTFANAGEQTVSVEVRDDAP